MEKKEIQDFKFSTKATQKIPHIKAEPLSTPIYASSTFKLEDANHASYICEKGGVLDPNDKNLKDKSQFLYTRWSNPTTDVAGKLINKLEGGYATLLTSSGMGAVTTTLFGLLKPGDHIIAAKTVYSATYEILKNLLPIYGIEVSLIDDQTNFENFVPHLKKNTKVCFVETPANPTLGLTDLEKISSFCKKNNLISIVDSTFASPYNQTPIIDYEFDVVIHSCTKYLNGHSDVVAGCIVSRTKEIFNKIYYIYKLFGANLSPFDAFLLERGVKTLPVRVKQHNENALEIAKFLEKHPKVKKVYYPGLKSHPQHELAKKQMKGFGGMISFDVGSLELGQKVIENVKIIQLAVSLGGVESIIEQASTMTHAKVTKEDREKCGITDGLVRLSVGLEDVEDLKKDLEQALN